MTQEEFDKAPLLDQILYDETGMLVENHPGIAEVMEKYHQAKLKLLGIAELSLEEILRDAVRRQATYQVQFADYDLNTWTAPCQLTQNRMNKLLDDASIRKVRLELEF